jgi:hypothetical protein
LFDFPGAEYSYSENENIFYEYCKLDTYNKLEYINILHIADCKKYGTPCDDFEQNISNDIKNKKKHIYTYDFYRCIDLAYLVRHICDDSVFSDFYKINKHIIIPFIRKNLSTLTFYENIKKSISLKCK